MPGCVAVNLPGFFLPKIQVLFKKITNKFNELQKINPKEVTKKWSKFQNIC